MTIFIVLLFYFNNPINNLLIQLRNIEYVSINKKQIENMKINIFDRDGNIFN